MRRYFDAFVYTANWCSCRLSLRVPLSTFRKVELKYFAGSHSLAIEASEGHWVFGWSLNESENYDRFSRDDGNGWMRRLVSLRDELLRGDLCPLYLGWLASACELGDGTREPDVPPGLANLSPAQQVLVEFIEIDPDMLAAAAGSAHAPETEYGETAEAAPVDPWLDSWSREEMEAILTLIAQGRGPEAERQVRLSHAAWLHTHRPSAASAAPRHNLGQLRQLANSAADMRLPRETEERAAHEIGRRQQHEAALRLLIADVDKRWATIETLVLRGSASGYEQAVRAVSALAEGYALTSNFQEFDRSLRRLLVRHATRGALLHRLTEAGLWSG